MSRALLPAALALTVIILISVFVATQPPAQEAEQPVKKPFYVGVQFGYGDAAACRALVDKVKNYTNLIVISNTAITTDEELLNETCDYIYNAGLHMIIYFPEHQDFSYSQNSFPVWALKAKEKYGDYFIGTYIYDEVAGRVLDRDPGCVSINYVNNGRGSSSTGASDYKVAASNFVTNAQTQMQDDLYLAQKSGTEVITADYGLYWFDYKAGYSTVLAEFGWGNDHQMAIALCRGAATTQGKDWGAIICWECSRTDELGYIEDGSALYNDLVLAYDNGAKYAIIFNYAGKDQPNPYEFGIMNEEHFEALQNFWEYVQRNPEKHGSVIADIALVLPEAYGFGFRSSIDKIWGLDVACRWKEQIWNDTCTLLSMHGSSLDIVYGDPEFQSAIAKNYANVIRWTISETAENYSVVNLNNSLGYPSIQEAISSMTTFSGDTIFVKSGIYKENLMINKAISLVGENKETTIIDGGNFGSAVRFTGVSGASLTGFTIKNGRPYQNGTFSGNNTEAITQLLKQYGLDVNNISELNATMLNALMSYISQQSGQNNVSAGIYLTNANNCTIRGNIVEDSACGILLSSSENNSLTDNSLANNDYGIGVVATSLQHYVNYICSSNTVNGKPIYYWVGKSNSTVPSDAGSVALINCTNITAQNLTLIGNYNGMLVINTKDSSIIGNTIIGNYEGLTIQNSSGNILRNNLISENNLNLNYGNNTLPNDIDASNMINGKPIYIWYKENDKTVPPDAGYVALIDCARITVQNLQLSNGQGILLQNTNNSKVIGNTLTNMDFGLFLSNSSNNIVSQNTVTASEDAIIVSYCSDITVSGNKVSDCKNNGIVILTSNSNRIESNMLTNNTKGLLIQDSSFNKISDNSFSSNNYALQFTATGPQSSSDFGVKNNNCTANSVTKNTFERNQYGVHYAMGTYNNNFCKNNFIENTQQVYTSYYSPRSSNVWDSRQEGNYWSNYNGTDTNHDGIGDQPMIIYGNQDPIRYPISSTNDQDHFPLMEPFTE